MNTNNYKNANKAHYYRKESNASTDSIANNSLHRKSTIGSHLEAKGNINKRYKKIKSPTQNENDTKRLEKCFRAISNINNLSGNQESMQNIGNVSIKI